jgi:hypothetical protein
VRQRLPILTPSPARLTLTAMTRRTCLVLSLTCALLALGCGHNSNRNTSAWMKSVNSIKTGTEMSKVKDKLGKPDVKRTGETPVRPYPPAGAPEGVLSTLPPDTKYEEWIYKRGDSRYHVFFAKTATEPRTWQVIAVRSAPASAIY